MCNYFLKHANPSLKYQKMLLLTSFRSARITVVYEKLAISKGEIS